MIRGKIPVIFEESCVRNMEVGAVRYVSIYDFIFTPKCVALSQFILVKTWDEVLETVEVSTYVPINRVGPGLSEYDFSVDFSNIDKYSFELPYLDNYSFVKESLEISAEQYIFFREFSYEIFSEEDVVSITDNYHDQESFLSFEEQL